MRRFLAGILYLGVGLPVVLSSLLALSIRPWALDRNFYSRAVDDPRLWIALRSPVARRNAPAKVEIGGYVFSGPALYGAIQGHLPEAELKSLANGTIDEVFNAVDSGKSGLALDLRPLKADLKKNSDAMLADYLSALPVGAPAELSTDLSQRPAGPTDAALADRDGKAVKSLIDSIPDEVRREFPASGGNRVDGARISAKDSFDRWSSTGVAAGAALLLGLGFLGGGGVGRSLARAGRFLMFPSALILAAGVALSIPGAPVALDVAFRAGASADLGFLKALGGWLGSWLGIASRSFFVVGLSGLSVGALLASVRRILEPREY